MGAVLAKLLKHVQNDPVDIPLDWAGAKAIAGELTLYREVSTFLEESPRILASVRDYQGCTEQIRQAISKPSPETEAKAWKEIGPCVLKMKQWFDYSIELQKILGQLLKFLSDGPILERAETYQASGKLLGEILSFASLFDGYKMSNSKLQNDFSYYRRTLSKRRMSPSNNDGPVPVDEQDTNAMSYFYANAAPMTKAIIDCVATFSNKQFTDLFAVIGGICYHAVAKDRVSGQLAEFCKRTMVTAIIVYDNVDRKGAFGKDSFLNMKDVVKMIKEDRGEQGVVLFNTLKYSTIHLNDDATPKDVKKLFVDFYAKS